MPDVQLYLAIGTPTIAVFIGMLINGYWFNSLNARMTALENRMTSFENRMETRISTLENRIYSQLEILTGKIADMDNRLSVVEDRFRR